MFEINLPSAHFCILTEVDNSSSWKLLYFHGVPFVAIPCDLGFGFIIGSINEVGHNSKTQQNSRDEGTSELGPTKLSRRENCFNLECHTGWCSFNR